MRKILLLALLLTAPVQAAPFAQGDAARGAQLFSHYDCNRCHRDMVDGDGSAIFTRPNRRVTSADNLVNQLKRCSGMIGTRLTAQEEQDLAAHLNQRYYKFK